MAWNFDQIAAYARQYAADSRPDNTELAFVFSEYDAESGLLLSGAYPATRQSMPPEAELTGPMLQRLYVDIGSGWEPITGIAAVQRVGLGTPGQLASGIETSIVIVSAGSVAAGYILATSDTLNTINTERTTGIALIRVPLSEDGTSNLPPDEPFTGPQVTALAAWLNAHGVTNEQFSGWFEATPEQVLEYLTTHPRVDLAKEIHRRWGTSQ